MALYKLTRPAIPNQESNSVIRLDDGVVIPFNPTNSDYQTYLKWLGGYEWQMVEPMKMEWVKVSDSNTPQPADQ